LWPLTATCKIALVEDVSELNKRKVRFFVEAVWNEGRLDLIEELIAADYTGCFARLESRVLGPEGVRQLVSSRRRAYPELYIKIEDQIAEDDRVVTRWRAAAEANGGAALACTRQCSGISIVRLLAGKQVDSHTEMHDHRIDGAV
jgi:predicted ester cyclase